VKFAKQAKRTGSGWCHQSSSRSRPSTDPVDIAGIADLGRRRPYFRGLPVLDAYGLRAHPEHPPAVKMLAAVPLLSMPLKVPEVRNRFFMHEAFLDGKEFLFGYIENSHLREFL
jgi:hypothetical protein